MAPTRSLKVVITGDSRDFDRALKSADDRLGQFNVAIGNSTHQTKVFQDSLNLIKPAGMIAGIGMAAQAVTALGGAGVATASALAPLAGALAAYPALAVAAAQGLGVMKLATAGLSDGFAAMTKGGQEWEKWLKGATRAQHDFMLQMRPLRDTFRGLQQDVQNTALPKFAQGVASASGNLGRLAPIAHDTANAIGDLAVRAGAMLGSGIWGRDFSRIGENNVNVIRRLGSAALFGATALRDIVSEAQPLVSWLSRGAEKFAALAQNQIFAARESGKLRDFFHETQIAMSRVVRIGADVATAFFNIAKAGKPLGDDILIGIVRAADAFRKWTVSASGQNAIKKWFSDARPVVFEVGRLVRDATIAFGRLGGDVQLAPMIEAIRTQLLPVLTDLVSGTTAAFGPALVSALTNIARLFASLGGSSGPLAIFVQLIGNAAGALADLAHNNPALQSLVVTIAGLAAVIKAVRFVGMITGLTTVIGAIGALKTAYMAETGAQTASTVAAVRWRVSAVASAVAGKVAAGASKAWAAAQWLLNAALTANPISLVIVGVAALGAGLVVAYKKSETFRRIVNGAWDAIKSAAETVFPIVKKMMSLGLLGPIGLAITHFGTLKRVAASVWGALRSTAETVFPVVKKLVSVGLIDPLKLVVSNFGTIRRAASSAWSAIKTGADAVAKSVQAVGSAFGAVAGVVKKVGGALNPFGDGIGMALPGGAGLSGGNGLMGAKQIMAPFASMAGRFGLHTSSGARPGSITSSGNVSWHSSGNAIDEAGSPAGMLGYFRYLKANFGSRLRELIYTPGGVGVKDGKPYRYTGQVAADHYDHVHVAFTGDGHGRKAGTGDGLGRFDATAYGPPWGGIQGTGVTATGVNLKGSPHIYGVAVDPKVIRLGSKLKISPNPFNYGGAFTAFDTGGAIKGNRIDFYDWRGRAAQNGWGHRNVSVSTYSGGSGGSSGGSGGGGPSKPTHGSSGGPPPTVDNKAIYGGELQGPSAAQVFANSQRKAPVKGRVGTGPVKGVDMGVNDARQARLDNPPPGGPTHEDYIRANIARARLTDDSSDDILYTSELLDLKKSEMDAALADSDPRNDDAAISAYIEVRDALKTLTDATKANTDALEEQRKQYETLIAQDYRSKYNVSQSQYEVLAQAIADVANGQIGQRLGLGMSGLRAPAGSVSRA